MGLIFQQHVAGTFERCLMNIFKDMILHVSTPNVFSKAFLLNNIPAKEISVDIDIPDSVPS